MTWTAKKLIKTEPVESQLPEHLQFILRLAKSKLNLKKVILFGSRARGDARVNSDFDLAFDLEDKTNWVDFKLEVEESSPSLYNYDLISLSEVAQDYKKSIAQRE